MFLSLIIISLLLLRRDILDLTMKCLFEKELSYSQLTYCRSLPPEIGDLIQLRELMLGHNYLRSLPFELGKLFQLLVSLLKIV